MRMLGSRELEVLKTLVANGGGAPYWVIVEDICKCRGKKECAGTSCKVSVTRALRTLRKKGLVYKKRYLGKVMYYLTKDGKRLLLDLSL